MFGLNFWEKRSQCEQLFFHYFFYYSISNEFCTFFLLINGNEIKLSKNWKHMEHDCWFYSLFVYKIVWYEWHKKCEFILLLNMKMDFARTTVKFIVILEKRKGYGHTWKYDPIINCNLYCVCSDERKSKLAAALKAGKSWTCLNHKCKQFMLCIQKVISVVV